MVELVEEKHCTTVEEFWAFLSPVGPHFWANSSLFRGQRDSSWNLIPSIFRPDVLERYERPSFKLDRGDERSMLQFECELLSDFISACDARGLVIPGDTHDARRVIEELSFDGQVAGRLKKWPGPAICPIIALAQHHGIPTRLLDVTSQPYVAAYFAAASAVEHLLALSDKSKRDTYLREQRLSVHAMNYSILHVSAGVRCIKVPGSTSPNVSAQSGAFIVLDRVDGEDTRSNGAPSIEAKLTNIARLSNTTGSPVGTPQLWKVTLPINCAGALLDWCVRHGIHRASMFPGYDGAAERVKETYRQVQFNEVVASHCSRAA
jgi:hypothetical protein